MSEQDSPGKRALRVAQNEHFRFSYLGDELLPVSPTERDQLALIIERETKCVELEKECTEVAEGMRLLKAEFEKQRALCIQLAEALKAVIKWREGPDGPTIVSGFIK